MNDRTKILILGAGYAGRMAATRLTTLKVDADIVVIDRAPGTYGRIRLHQILSGGRRDSFVPHQDLLPDNVDFVQDSVLSVDRADQRVWLKSGESLGYDYLVYALGSYTAVPARFSEFAQSIEATSRGNPVKRGEHVVVVGAGLTGVEVAAELATSGRTATLLGPALTPELHDKTSAYIASSLTQLGVNFEQDRVTDVCDGELQLSGGKTLKFSRCIWSAGFAVPDLARDSGLITDELGRVEVERDLRSANDKRIFVVGDAARVPSQIPTGVLRASCAAALPMAAHAAHNLAALLKGRDPSPFRYADAGICISLGRKDGVVQFMNARGPTNSFLRGRIASFVKEEICKMVDYLPRYEQTLGVPLYTWQKADLSWTASPWPMGTENQPTKRPLASAG